MSDMLDAKIKLIELTNLTFLISKKNPDFDTNLVALVSKAD